MPRDPRGQMVEREFLRLPVWDQFDARTAEAVARSVERCLPEPWKFVRVGWHECGDQKRHVAFFRWKKVRFALVPGGKITLGYDRKKPFVPTPEQQESWAWTREGFGFPTLRRHLADTLTPLRTAVIAPALVEVKYTEVEFTDDEAELDDDERTAAASARLARDGFRVPTADEWEHFCAAGSRTLWRWGNTTHLWGKLARRPNAFGLIIADNPYNVELVENMTGFRGGDGGTAMCGGYGEFATVLPLASAYRMPPDYEEVMRASGCEVFCRRVYPLPDEMLG